MPERTCVTCRARRPAAELIRLALGPSGRVEVDLGGLLPGRGAWVCPRAVCVLPLERKTRSLGRTLRVPGLSPEATTDLRGRVRDAVVLRCRRLLADSHRAGLVLSGADHLRHALPSAHVLALIPATDASPRSLADARSLAGEALCVDIGLDRFALGRLLGSGRRAVLAVQVGRPGNRLACQLRWRRDLG